MGSRRAFIGSAIAAGAVTAACGGSAPKKQVDVPMLHDEAPDGPELKAALVGCGGRGSGAAQDFIDASPTCKVVALADLFPDRIESCRQKLKDEKGVEIPDNMCFSGFDAYKKALDAGVDVMLHATPPHFRPEHFKAAVDAGKHVFIEKPSACDPTGVKSVIATAGQAKTKNLTVVSGTCWRHHKKVIETYRRVGEGMIGDIVAARAYFNTGQLWFRDRKEDWSDMEFMIRDWVNWNWLSGDHIVEQHVHNLDTQSLFLGMTPIKAVGFGGRHRRVTGDQFDFFNIDFEYENGLHMQSYCRQIDGCKNNVSDHLTGTNGSTNCRGMIWDADGNVVWNFDDEFGKEVRSMYKQEHVDFVTSIRTSEARNEVVETAYSTLMGISGRESAYTGKEVVLDEMLESGMTLGPDKYELGSSDMINNTPPVPGQDKA